MVKNPPANAGNIRDVGSIPGLGKSPGGRRDNPNLQLASEVASSLVGLSPEAKGSDTLSR